VPAEAEEWTLATLHERLVKTGARIVFAEISFGLTCAQAHSSGHEASRARTRGASMMDEELLEGDPILSRARKAVPSTLRAPF